MIRLLLRQFPARTELFAGWPTPPIDPNSATDPMPDNGEPKAFDPNKIQAIDGVQTQIGNFASDEDCGLFIETSLRRTPGKPRHRSPDARTGIHNYLHNRFSDSDSDIDMGNPQVNIENQRFWRLHGWIDNCWSAFRKGNKGIVDQLRNLSRARRDDLHIEPVIEVIVGRLINLAAKLLPRLLWMQPDCESCFLCLPHMVLQKP